MHSASLVAVTFNPQDNFVHEALVVARVPLAQVDLLSVSYAHPQ